MTEKEMKRSSGRVSSTKELTKEPQDNRPFRKKPAFQGVTVGEIWRDYGESEVSRAKSRVGWGNKEELIPPIISRSQDADRVVQHFVKSITSDTITADVAKCQHPGNVTR